ncbi:hypothetical protein [Natrarchaeobius oligotrophus]|nr:hypothetical protein [Natrarchaeobius chitinivorans]
MTLHRRNSLRTTADALRPGTTVRYRYRSGDEAHLPSDERRVLE